MKTNSVNIYHFRHDRVPGRNTISVDGALVVIYKANFQNDTTPAYRQVGALTKLFCGTRHKSIGKIYHNSLVIYAILLILSRFALKSATQTSIRPRPSFLAS